MSELTNNFIQKVTKSKVLVVLRNIEISQIESYVSLLVEGGVDRFVSIILENKLPFSGSKKNLIFESSKL